MAIQSKLTSLSAALRSTREKILSEWLGSLRIGREKPGLGLTDDELRDNFAELLEDLCLRLEAPQSEPRDDVLQHAESHGDLRWVQGYHLPELIREISALRTVVVIATVAYSHDQLNRHEQNVAHAIIHRFFDTLLVESASVFATLVHDATVLQERQLLAQELHDRAAQNIQGAILLIAAANRQMKPPPHGQLDQAASSLHHALAEIRSIVRGLVSLVSQVEHGLAEALQMLATESSRLLPCTFASTAEGPIPQRHAFHLFWIAHEAIQNAARHAQAQRLEMTLSSGHGALQLRLRDDGRGFELPAEESAGTGLLKMQQRARAIGGRLTIESGLGRGTIITCRVPVIPAAGPPLHASGGARAMPT